MRDKILFIFSIAFMLWMAFVPILFAEEITNKMLFCSIFWSFVAGIKFQGDKHIFMKKER